MTALSIPWAADLLHVWFHRLTPSEWFDRSDNVDTMLQQRFVRMLRAMQNRPTHEFLAGPDRTLAAILLFDQIPRNVYRDTPRMFAFDDKASTLSRFAIRAGLDKNLPDNKRQFLAMPLMHSESIADQKLSLAYYGAHLPNILPFARSHHRMIARFGRFPHRNTILGRTTMPREQQAIQEGFSW